MNEASVTAALKTKMQEKGFYVVKISDKTTQGLPDLVVVNNWGNVFFLEVKFFERAAEPTQFKAFSNIGLGVQLMTMVQLSKKKAKAFYAIVFKIPQQKLKVFLLKPTDLLNSIQIQQAVPIRGLVDFNTFVTALESDHLSL